MNETARISRAPPDRISMNYAALREGGMALIRQWAEETWTDHNVHDPGITLLETFSYAMTELGLRLQLDVADLLRSGEAHAAADLEPAHRVLPQGPVTAVDLRRLLLDHPLVSDAQISLPADGEIPFYENAGGDPPLTYAPETPRVRPGGLYEVVVEFRERELNSNTYSLQVASGGHNYDVDLALPHWDEDEAAPFRLGAVINTITMLADGAEVWRPLPEPQSYFGEISVDYSDASGAAGTVVLWVLLSITTVLVQPAVVAPGILAEVRTALESSAAGHLARFAERVRSAAAAVGQLQRYLSGWRNLGEEAVRLAVARIQEIAVRARLELTGGIDVERLLAEIFMDVDRMLSPRVRFQSLAERRSGDGDAGQIYDGPLLRHGFLDTATLEVTRPSVLYTSDLLRLIMRRRDGAGTDVVAQENPGGRAIITVTDLAVSNFINNRSITTEAADCLHLVEIERYRPRLSLAKSQIITVRNDSEVAYNLNRVESLFEGLQQQEQAGAFTADPSPDWRPVSRGDLLPVEDYTPFQNDLPSLYGVGEAALPDSASTQRLAAAKQLKGYLLLFEQVLADATTQLGHINRFFSADPEEDATYFTRPLFELPGIAALLKRFPPAGDWPAFVADPDNPVARALWQAAESREQRLDRRNRMLDHLLARQGEDMVAFGQELHRWAQRELLVGGLPPDQLSARLGERREAANARLIRAKAALLRDAPELNAFRLLAGGCPLGRDSGLLRIDSTAAGFRWTLVWAGQDRLRSIDAFDTAAAATIAAEEGLILAGRNTFYAVVDIGGGQRRYRLTDDADATARLVGVSPQTYPSDSAAATAMAETAAVFVTLRLESSLAPMERRIAHLTGIRSQVRRRLLAPVDAHFEILDEAAGGGLIAKRWRFRELPGQGGQVLLGSVSPFEAATEAAAITLAEESIRQVLRYGADEWNYRVSPTGATTYRFELQDPANQALALRDTPWDSRSEAERGIAETVDRLYRSYSAEGFHLIEHLRLRPRRAGEPFLSLPISETARERDPYSQRVSLVFPSGHARDFSLPRKSAPTMPVTPHRFRDPEFRYHAEWMARQSCPAHLLPSIYWVDRQTPGSPDSPASFDRFEDRYFTWLDSVLIPGAPAATVDTARTELVEALNAIANDRP